MDHAEMFPVEGGCDCGMVRYRMVSAPLFVNGCHCRWCQRESGASFALNAMIEADRVINLGEPPELVQTPSESGYGHVIARCPHCRVAVWSNYAGAGPLIKFVRVGTLDNPDLLPPDIHIFTQSKQPWIIIPEGVPSVLEYYDREEYWPQESLVRWQKILPHIEAYRATRKSVARTPICVDHPINQVLAAYKTAVFEKDVETFMQLYGQEVRVFDAWGTWSYQGAAAWRMMVEEWFAPLGSERVKVTVDELQIIGGQGLGVLGAIVTYAGVSAEGKELRALQNRLTWALRSEGDAWTIVHEHTSAPIDFGKSKAILQREKAD